MIEPDIGNVLKNVNVLVIDDSISFQNLTNEMLIKFGVNVIEFASSLSEGLKKLNYSSSNHSNFVGYDLVLLDINLPDGNGVSGCNFVTHHAGTLDIPVIIISGAYNPLIVEEVFRLGAVDFIQKPFVSALLKKRLCYALNDALI